jgi:hypothetical protein
MELTELREYINKIKEKEEELLTSEVITEGDKATAFFDDLIQRKEYQAQLREKFEYQNMTPQEVQKLLEADDGGQAIAKFLGVDSETDEGQKAIETFRSSVGEMAIGFDSVVRIDDSQFSELINVLKNLSVGINEDIDTNVSSETNSSRFNEFINEASAKLNSLKEILLPKEY